jgi:hypothetical protein
MMLLKPSDIAAAASDIVEFVNSDKLSDNDKKRILEMVRDFYQDRNEHIIDQYLHMLTQRTIDKHYPQTGFEQDV